MQSQHQHSSLATASLQACVDVPLWKRALDLTCSLVALPLLAPLVLLMVAITRWKAPGPVIFKQVRIGLRGRPFTILKFRTMKAEAATTTHENHLKDLIQSGKPMVKMDAKGDARLIPGGRWLRATGLDELPQIINVLRGDMSLVGPRPCTPFEYDHYTPWQRERFNTLPGLTGLWQVSGKNRTTFQEMMNFDIKYARTKTLWMDIKIMILTPAALFVQVVDSRRAVAKSRRSEVAATHPAALPNRDSTHPGSAIMARNARRQLVQFRISDDIPAARQFPKEENA